MRVPVLGQHEQHGPSRCLDWSTASHLLQHADRCVESNVKQVSFQKGDTSKRRHKAEASMTPRDLLHGQQPRNDVQYVPQCTRVSVLSSSWLVSRMCIKPSVLYWSYCMIMFDDV